ncbi:unnamed protein product [Trichogramma brassicae]|uniref:Uncharacterized protein n=1 Tax=Trichogramma brassicae TaxID=86971 RepID=A0A6H5I7Y1_9HYME|nr:unnamed protein product [Trichogramma brassicae]
MPSQLGSDPRLDYPEPQQQQQQHEVAKHPSLESVLARKLELMAAIAAAARMHQLRERLQQQQDEQQQQARRRQPEFTFSFGKVATSTDDDTPRPFAVAPNDPRYYEEEPPLVDQREADRLFSNYDLSAFDPKTSIVSIADTDEETLKTSRVDTPIEQHQLQQQQQQQQKQKQTIASEMQDEDSDLQGPRQSMSVTNKAIIDATTSRKVWKSARDENEADWLPEVNVGPVTSSFAFGMLPEPQRRAEHDPLVVSLDKDGSNRDLYFIGNLTDRVLFLFSFDFQSMLRNKNFFSVMVAGCSAAAMFALVLISLTWCRSSNQEAGSVSEPESDEENDEGDYTVYECPGLAPVKSAISAKISRMKLNQRILLYRCFFFSTLQTGEMEVKNPLFHDDSVTSQKSKPRPNGKDA